MKYWYFSLDLLQDQIKFIPVSPPDIKSWVWDLCHLQKQCLDVQLRVNGEFWPRTGCKFHTWKTESPKMSKNQSWSRPSGHKKKKMEKKQHYVSYQDSAFRWAFLFNNELRQLSNSLEWPALPSLARRWHPDLNLSWTEKDTHPCTALYHTNTHTHTLVSGVTVISRWMSNTYIFKRQQQYRVQKFAPP